MEAADESVSRQVEPGRDSPILVTFRQAGLTPIEPAPLPIGVVYAYNSDIAAGRTRSPSQLSGAAAQRGLEAVMARHHETVQRADSCGSDEAMGGGDSSGSAGAAGIKRSGSRIAWLSPRRRSQRARAEREEREVEQAMDGDNEPGAELEQEPFGGEGLEWIRGRNDAQSGGPTHKLPMAPPPTSRLPRMLVKALSGARRSAARRDAGAPPAAAAPTAATRATRASASSARASVDGSVAFGCDCAVASASSRSPPNPNPNPTLTLTLTPTLTLTLTLALALALALTLTLTLTLPASHIGRRRTATAGLDVRIVPPRSQTSPRPSPLTRTPAVQYRGQASMATAP